MFNLSGLGPLLNLESPDELESILKRLDSKTNDPESKRRLNELKLCVICALAWI